MSPLDPPVLYMKAAPTPNNAVITRNLAFQSSTITSFIHVNIYAKPVKVSTLLKIKPQTQILMNKDIMTRRVTMSKIIATKGGTIDKISIYEHLHFYYVKLYDTNIIHTLIF